MTVYLLLEEREISIQGYPVGIDTHIIGVYGDKKKAIHAMMAEDDEDPFVDYKIVPREVM